MNTNSASGVMDEKWLDRIGVELEHPGMLIVQRLSIGCTLTKLKLEFEALLQAAENRGSDLIESSLQHTTPLQKHVQSTSKQLQSVSTRLSTTASQIKGVTGKLEKLERTISRLLDTKRKLSAVKSVISSILFTTRHFIDICSELKDQIEDNDSDKYHNNTLSPYSYIYTTPYYINDANSLNLAGSRTNVNSGKTFNLSNVEYLRVIAIEIGKSRQSIQELKNVNDNLQEILLPNTSTATIVVADDDIITTAIGQLCESLNNLEQFSDWSIKIMLEMVQKSLKSKIIRVDNFGKNNVTDSNDLNNFLNLLKCYYALSPKKSMPTFLTLFHDIIEKCLGSTAALDAGPEEQFNEFQKFAENILLELNGGSVNKFLDKLATYEGSEVMVCDLASILGNQIFSTIERHFRYIFAPVYKEPFLKAVGTIVKLLDSVEALAGPSSIAIWRGTDIPKSVANALCISPLLQSLTNSIIERMHNQTLHDSISPQDIVDVLNDHEMKLYLSTSDELIRGCMQITETLRFFEYYPLMARVISDLIQLYTSHLRSFVFWEREMKECQVDGDETWPQGITPSHAVYLLSDLKELTHLFAKNGKISNALLSHIEYPKSVLQKIKQMSTDAKSQETTIPISEFVDQLTSISYSFLEEAVSTLDKVSTELVSQINDSRWNMYQMKSSRIVASLFSS